MLHTDLMYLTIIGGEECYHLLENFGHLLIPFEYSYKNINGESALSISIEQSNSDFLNYFLSLSWFEKYNLINK